MADELEALSANQVLDVAPGAGEKVVDADHFRALRQQPVAQMRAQKAGAAGHHDALLEVHEPKRRPPGCRYLLTAAAAPCHGVFARKVNGGPFPAHGLRPSPE